MADPTTPNIGLAQPVTGTDVGTWGSPLNSNFGSIDTKLAGTVALSTAAPGTLTGAQTLTARVALTTLNALSSDYTITMLSSLAGGNCTIDLTGVTNFGGHSVLVNTTAGSGRFATITDAGHYGVTSDGTNVDFAQDALPSPLAYLRNAALEFFFEGSGSPVTNNTQVVVEAPFNCTVTNAKIWMNNAAATCSINFSNLQTFAGAGVTTNIASNLTLTLGTVYFALVTANNAKATQVLLSLRCTKNP